MMFRDTAELFSFYMSDDIVIVAAAAYCLYRARLHDLFNLEETLYHTQTYHLIQHHNSTHTYLYLHTTTPHIRICIYTPPLYTYVSVLHTTTPHIRICIYTPPLRTYVSVSTHHHSTHTYLYLHTMPPLHTR